jgi:predicted protein tyrosine phosphatase
MHKTKLLFVCTGNRDRSPTAEELFRISSEYEARSAGTGAFAVQKVTQELIDWADKIMPLKFASKRLHSFPKGDIRPHCRKIAGILLS